MTHELAKYRRVLLLTELVGVVHDVGKLAEDLDKKGKTVRPFINHLFIPYIELFDHKEIEELKLPGEEDQYTQYSENKYKSRYARYLKSGSVFSKEDIENYKLGVNRININYTLRYILKELLEDEKIRNLFVEDGNPNVNDISFISLFLRHHSNYDYHPSLHSNSTFTRIIDKADNMDSKEERFERSSRWKKKGLDNGKSNDSGSKQFQMQNVSSVFGADKGSNGGENLDSCRFKVYKKVQEILEDLTSSKCEEAIIHDKIMKLQIYLDRAAAMSVLPENDSTVWDHGFMVGSIAKSQVAGKLLGTDKLHILSLQYTGRDYLTEIYRLPDFVGRAEGLQQASHIIKSMIEVEYCLGNLVYTDVNGMYFIVPDLTDSPLKGEIESKVKKIFAEYTELTPFLTFKEVEKKNECFNFGKPVVEVKKSFETNFKRKLSGIRSQKLELPDWCHKWDEKNVNEVCHVCKRRPATYIAEERYEGDKLCKWCKDIRDKAFSGNMENARFIDQIIDENHRFALLTGDIGLFDLWLQGDYIKTTRLESNERLKPKNASPSRIRRVFIEAEDFQSDVESLVSNSAGLRGIVYNHRFSERVKSDGFWSHNFNAEELRRIIESEVRLLVSEEELKKITMLIFDRLTFTALKYKVFVYRSGQFADGVVAYSKELIPQGELNWPNILKGILSKYFTKPRLFELESKKKDKEEQELVVFLENHYEITKARKIYGMADEFMYLVPANQAISIISEIEKFFDERFGRVKGRLSLNLGLTYSNHKYPLYLVLDAGKRMLKEFREAVIRERVFDDSSSTWEGLKARLCISPERNDGFNQIIFEDSLLKGERIRYEVPEPIKIVPKSRPKIDRVNDDFYAGVISLEGTPQMLNCTKISSFKKPTEIPILYAPHLIDFEYLDNVRSRIQLALDKSSGEWRKRKHLIPQLRKRPYIRETFCELIKFNEELNKYSVSSTALKKLEFGLVEQFQRLFHDEEEYLGNRGFLPDLVESLIMSIDSVKKFYQSLDVVRRAAWVEMICDGRFFDLMELRTFIQAFPERED